jgi:hypothetical protein
MLTGKDVTRLVKNLQESGIEASYSWQTGEAVTQECLNELSRLSQNIVVLRSLVMTERETSIASGFMVMATRTMNTYLQQVMLICGWKVSLPTMKTTEPDPTLPKQLMLPLDWD